MKPRGSKSSATGEGGQTSPSSPTRTRSREGRARGSSRSQRVAIKRGQKYQDAGPHWKRQKGDETLLTEHELSGTPGSEWCRVGLPSCNAFRGSVFEVGKTFSDFMQDIQKGSITSYPDEYVHYLRQKKFGGKLVTSVESFINRRGFAFYSSDIRLCLNLVDADQKPDIVVCDVVILTHSRLPVVMTVIDGTKCRDIPHDVKKYSHSLSRELTYTMRNFTDEGFNIFDSIVDICDISKEFLLKLCQDVCDECQLNMPVEKLCMSKERCISLTRALLAQGHSSTVNHKLETQISKNLKRLDALRYTSPERKPATSFDHLRTLDNSSIYLLTPEQFQFINSCVNTGQVLLVTSKEGTGKIRFALEAAHRLSLQASTLVLCESEDFKRRIRLPDNVRIVTRQELQCDPGICDDFKHFVVVKAEQMEIQSGKELIFDWHHYLEQAIHTRTGKLIIVYDRRDDPDIEECDIRALETREQDLVKCLIPDDLVLELLSKKVLSIADLIWIKKRTTREDQNEELIKSLKRSSRRGYDIFLRSLRKTRQGHLADLLETDNDAKDILMSSEHLELLSSANNHLIHRMIPFGVLNRLYKLGVFTTSDISRIQAEKSIDLINEVLLNYLSGKPDKCFGHFLESLTKTSQEDLQEMLESGDVERAPQRSLDNDKLTSQVKATLMDKVDMEDLLLELECSNLIHKNDLRYVRSGNNLGEALPETDPSEGQAALEEKDTVRKVVGRLFELLSRKPTSPCDTLIDCLRRTGQYEVVEVLQRLQGLPTSHLMDTEDSAASYRTLNVRFIETKAFQAVLDRLSDSSEVFIVLTGAPGEGKTTAALQALRHQPWPMRKLVIKSPEDFNRQVNMDTRTTVVLDDVFGIVEVDETAVRQWIPILQRIKKHSESKKPNIKVIITSRNHVWRAADAIGDLTESIIPVTSVIDFTVLVPLVRPEKKRMLDTHLDKYSIDLDPALVDRIAETHGTLGFPLCCKLFAAEPMFQDNPVDFFTNPLSYIVKRLSSSCEDPKNLTLIQQVVKSKGQLDRQKAVFGPISDQSVVNMKNYVFQEGNILYFPHKSIADAASYVMAKFSIDYLGECSLQFLYERVREKPTQGKSSDADIQMIHVNQKDLQHLIQRLANEMSAGNIALACSHPALNTKKSVGKLFTVFKDMVETVHLKDKKHGGSFLYWTTWNQSEHLCKEVLESVKDIKEADLCEAVLGCCLSGNKKALKELLKRTDIDTVRKSGIRFLPKISTRQQLVANESVRVIEVTGERMAHLSCKYGHTEIVEVLMDHGLDLNEKDLNGETCLLAACSGGNDSAVSYLLQHSAQWSQDKEGHTPLHFAVERENTDILKILLKEDAAIEFLNKTDTDGQSPLHLACLKKSPEMAEHLLQKRANVDVTDSCGWTPLHYVSWIGNKKIVDILIKYNVNVNLACKERSKSTSKLRDKGQKETEGMTALHLACHQGHVGIVKKLTDLPNIDVNITDVFGKSALYIASKRGNSHLVKILLDRKANTSLATLDCRTAVYAASKKGHDQVIELLCKSGIDLNTGTRSQRKRNPLYAASRKGYVMAVDTLLHYGADVNFKDSDGNTSLHVAAAARHTDVVKCLIKWGAEVMARNSSQLTPLHEAVAVKDPGADTIDYLLLAGADVNAVDSRKWTPLHLASLCGTGNIVKTLLLWKADVHARDMTDMTSLGYASAMGKVDNMSVLLQYNADIDKVCLCLAVIYGHADAVEMLLKEKLPVREVEEMYNLAKEHEHDKVLDVITRFRPLESV